MSIPAVVVGGSLGGLSSALALHCVNCDVDVFERSRGAMKSRAVASDNESPCCNIRQ
jgi:2-polyprenyl-6-methoxyphenol hydroxylase-like FAD-dependent oxidoreductase